MPGVLGTVYGQVRLDVRQAVAAYAAVRAQNAKMVYALRGTSESFIQSGRSMVTAGAGLVYIFGKAVSAAAEFQRRMDFFGAITNATAKDMDQLRKFTLKMGTDTIFTVDELADGFIELGKAGISAQDIMGGIGRAMANLGAAADIPLAESGQIITSVIKTWAFEAGKATHVVNELQGAANATIADVSDLGVSLKYVGGIAATTGISFSDTIDAISLLAQAGIRGSTAGTSLRQMLVSLNGATGPATEALKSLGIITKNGTNLFYDQAGNIKSLAKVFQILQDHTKNLSNVERLAAFRTIFNNRALASASILTRAGAKGFANMNKQIGKTTAAEIMHKRLDNLSGDIKILKANIQTMLVKAGSPFQEQIRGWVQQLTRLIQAFGKLDPKTQKLIVQFIGMSGAALITMGTFNLLIGVMLRFIANAIKMAAGVAFLVKWLKILIFNLRWLVILFGGEVAAALGISAAALAAIVAVIVIVVAGLVLLYLKWKPFRELINAFASAIWDAIKAIGVFLKLLATDPGAAWGKIKQLAKDVAAAIVQAFQSLAGKVWSWLKGAADRIGQFVQTAIAWFLSLPSKVVGIITDFVTKVISLLTFRNAGFVIGFMVGTVLKWMLLLQLRAIEFVGRMVSGILGLLAKLPGKVGFLIGFLVGRAILLWYKFMRASLKLMARLVRGVVSFLSKLPGKVIRLIVRTSVGAAHAFMKMVKALPHLAAEAVKGIINFIQQLPSRVAHFILATVAKSIILWGRFKRLAIQFAKGAAKGFIDALKNLPKTVSGILGKVIQAWKDVIKAGFDAAKAFASGLWNGFKKGLGINSPSLIERQMWQITDVMDEETKKMARHTMNVQKLSKQLADNQFGLMDPEGIRDSRSLVRLASMHARNQHRARTLAGLSGKRRAVGRARRGSGDRRAEIRITNWHEGRGHMREIAEDVVDDDASFNDFVGGNR